LSSNGQDSSDRWQLITSGEMIPVIYQKFKGDFSNE